MTLTGYIVGTKGNTGRGIASIVENADYTITINLTDGSSYTTAPIAGFTAVDFDENYDLVVTKTDGTTETVETDIADYNALLEGYKSEAYSYMQGAVNSASSAYSSAQSASGSATYAGTYAGQAYNYATSAQTSATSASSSATAAGTAKTAAETAQGKAEDAQDAAETAQGKAEDAQEAAETAATNANTYQGWAQDYANNAQTQAGYASTYKRAAYDSQVAAAASALVSEGYANGEQNGTPVTSDSPYYENNAKYYSEEAAASAASLTVDDELDGSSTNPVQNKVIKDELDSKANVDGYYESLGSGTADQLASNIYEEDNVPYNFRTSGGSIDIGDRETDMLVGGTVAWNQLLSTSSGEQKKTIYSGMFSTDNVAIYNGHRYLVSFLQPAGCGVYRQNRTNFTVGYLNYSAPTVATLRQFIATATGTSTENFGGLVSKLETTEELYQLTKCMLIDLTAMFGSTIADYIYSLEQANAGAGVAWFRKLFPKPYYAYNAGELMSVNTSAHNTVGFNQWDEEWEQGGINSTGQLYNDSSCIRTKNFIPIIPQTTYCFGKSLYEEHSSEAIGISVRYYDKDKNFISAETNIYTNWGENNFIKTTPSNAHFVKFMMTSLYGTTYNNDICVNLSWDGERDGEYEEYIKRSYPLDSSLTLRGIPKLDASNNLYYDGDRYNADGGVDRISTEVNLSEVTATTSYTGDVNKTVSLTLNPQFPQNYSDYAFIAEKYLYRGHVNSAYALSNPDTKDVGLYAYHNSTATDRFRVYVVLPKGESVSGKLVYKVATPTTETADPFQSPQIVDDFGTEEYVDYPYSQGTRDVAIPVGHETQYMANLKAKLEMSPNSPEGAGDYIVRQTNGENEYVTLASNATIQDIIARLEALEGGE